MLKQLPSHEETRGGLATSLGHAGRQLKLPQWPLHSQDFGKTLRSPGRVSARFELTSVMLWSADTLHLGFPQRQRYSQPGTGQGHGDGGTAEPAAAAPARGSVRLAAPALGRLQLERERLGVPSPRRRAGQPAPVEGSVLQPGRGGACDTTGCDGGAGDGGTSTLAACPRACPGSRGQLGATPFPYLSFGFCAGKR